jgi:type IV pilus assembly protein PilW
VLVRNVVAFRIQYGITDPGGTTLTGWQNATSIFAALSGATVDRVRALRIGIVTRSAQREKANASGACEASAAKPRDPLDATVELDPGLTDWACYRYRTAVAVVPLRNLAW